MSGYKILANQEYKIDFGSFPREIRAAIYRESLVDAEPIGIMDIYGYPNLLETYDTTIRDTFGILDGNNWRATFVDEAREVFYSENTFIVPCRVLPGFLKFEHVDPQKGLFRATILRPETLRQLSL